MQYPNDLPEFFPKVFPQIDESGFIASFVILSNNPAASIEKEIKMETSEIVFNQIVNQLTKDKNV